jgi:hypothetical protein
VYLQPTTNHRFSLRILQPEKRTLDEMVHILNLYFSNTAKVTIKPPRLARTNRTGISL